MTKHLPPKIEKVTNLSYIESEEKSCKNCGTEKCLCNTKKCSNCLKDKKDCECFSKPEEKKCGWNYDAKAEMCSTPSKSPLEKKKKRFSLDFGVPAKVAESIDISMPENLTNRRNPLEVLREKVEEMLQETHFCDGYCKTCQQIEVKNATLKRVLSLIYSLSENN